jgi:hypothetical protein
VITEGELAQWQVEVNGKRSGVQAAADRLDWTP